MRELSFFSWMKKSLKENPVVVYIDLQLLQDGYEDDRATLYLVVPYGSKGQ